MEKKMGMGAAVFALVLLVVGLLCFSLNESGEKEVAPALSTDWVNTYGPDQDVKMVQDADLICVGTVVDSYTELPGFLKRINFWIFFFTGKKRPESDLILWEKVS